jgi:alkanesulfonate monooxygenase SsuD/methylene tetrahydromethanopterin reductase-like flavin-dependent oxidoreductase (luciferase family)
MMWQRAATMFARGAAWQHEVVRIGVGLPTSTPGTSGPVLLEWARRAEQRDFSSLGVVDRLVYDCADPLVTLAAAAAVTSRVRLVTMIVIGPVRGVAVLAKQAASVDQLSGGRLILGVGLGARRDDYEAAGASWADRGRRLSDQLAALRDVWEGKAIGPRPACPGGPQLLVGGASGPAFLRAARYADGYVHGGGPPRAFAGATGRVRAAWIDVGRPGQPALWGQSYVALGDPAAGEAYLRDYYAFTGAFAGKIAAGLLRTPKGLREHIRGYADAGCDELVLLPATSDPAELDRLADAIG